MAEDWFINFSSSELAAFLSGAAITFRSLYPLISRGSLLDSLFQWLVTSLNDLPLFTHRGRDSL
jgi:hypothetical protein